MYVYSFLHADYAQFGNEKVSKTYLCRQIFYFESISNRNFGHFEVISMFVLARLARFKLKISLQIYHKRRWKEITSQHASHKEVYARNRQDVKDIWQSIRPVTVQTVNDMNLQS